jgi:hypothetical protein
MPSEAQSISIKHMTSGSRPIENGEATRSRPSGAGEWAGDLPQRILEMPIHRSSPAELQLKIEPLTYSHPQIGKSRFCKGAVSDKMWVHFTQFVQLCHAYRHWQQVCLKMRFPPPDKPAGQESKYARKKRYDEWKSEIHKSERYMYNISRLAAGKLAVMLRLLDGADPHESLDEKLCSALRLAVAPFPKHERGRFSAAAFRSFDADCELRRRPDEIASRWLRHAGYRGANLRINASLPTANPAPVAI